MKAKNILLTVMSLLLVSWGMAQYPVGPDGYERLGVMKGKSASEINSSTWSIGGETLDRDYADYHSYKKYLGPLGAKRIRLQSGWAKCEKVKGQYDFAWLDGIIEDAVSQGVQPWVSLSYGNPIYEGGGEAKLGGGFPSSPEALQAWDKWVKAIVTRYKDKVPEWEIWNEPNLTPKSGGKVYGDFYLRTAEIIRGIQPDARIFALALASITNEKFVTDFFDVLKQHGKLDMVDVVTYHGYTMNPDTQYPNVEKLRKLVQSFDSEIKLMQGENGCPSTPSSITVGALRQADWTELSQAKWFLRRMLGDHGRDIATNVFTLSDLHYQQGDHFAGVNSKGLLKTHADKTIDRPKLAYYAVQRVVGFFNADEVRLLGPVEITKGSSIESLSTFGYQHERTSTTVYTIWTHEERPAESFVPKALNLAIAANIKNPVYVDLVSGNVFSIPSSAIEVTDGQRVVKNIPIPDYPILIADGSAIPYQECR